jgi:hypothetical protein
MPNSARHRPRELMAAEQGAKVATFEPPAPPTPSPAMPSSDEQRAWDRIRDSGDQAALQDFIKRYPRSPLVLNAQKRLEIGSAETSGRWSCLDVPGSSITTRSE